MGILSATPNIISLSLSLPHTSDQDPIEIPFKIPFKTLHLSIYYVSRCMSLPLEDAMAHATRNIFAKLITTTANTCRRRH